MINIRKIHVTVPTAHPLNQSGFALWEQVFVGEEIADATIQRLIAEGFKVTYHFHEKIMTHDEVMTYLANVGKLPHS